jgi:hypothetical protein
VTDSKRWIEFLSEEDFSFVKRFVLASGSLKQMAATYQVTYPTIRLRLDRLIAKIQVIEQQEPISDFERLARAQFADGKIDLDTLRLLLRAHQAELEKTP